MWSDQRFAYDAVLLGQVEPFVIDVHALQRRLDRSDHAPVKESLTDVGFGELDSEAEGMVARPIGIDLLSTYAGQASFLEGWSRGAQINTDRNLRLQYLAGLSLNSSLGQRTLSELLAHYRFSDRTFVGSPESLQALRRALNRGGRRNPTSAAPKPAGSGG